MLFCLQLLATWQLELYFCSFFSTSVKRRKLGVRIAFLCLRGFANPMEALCFRVVRSSVRACVRVYCTIHVSYGVSVRVCAHACVRSGRGHSLLLACCSLEFQLSRLSAKEK